MHATGLLSYWLTQHMVIGHRTREAALLKLVQALLGAKSRQAPVWILSEPSEDIGLRPDQNITIQFAPGTTYETAQGVANALNKNAYRFKIWTFPESK